MSAKICRWTGKIKYRSIGEARAQAELIWEQNALKRQYDKHERSAYVCPCCHRWHLTSQLPWAGSTGVDLHANPS
jgi:hypothetical protein